MAVKIVWTPRAVKGFEEIITYIESNWTEAAVQRFIGNTDQFLQLLAEYPQLLQQSEKQQQVYRGAIDKHNILTYRFNSEAHQIELLNIRAAKRKPEE